MKKIKKLITAATALAMGVAAVAPLNDVFAASAPTWNEDLSSATVIRKIPNAFGSIDNTFTYTITAATTNPEGASGLPTSPFTIRFNDTYNTQTTATKTAILDFSDMRFERAGDYSYVITETQSSNPSIYPPVGSSGTYTVLLQIRNSESNINNLEGYLTVKDTVSGHKLGTISGSESEFIFESTPGYTNIQINETVSGNAADLTKCFSYRLNFDTNDSYVFSSESTCTNPETVGDGSIIQLKHQDNATIGLVRAGSQIPVGTHYSITKVSTDSYTTSMDNVERTAVSKIMAATSDTDGYNSQNVTRINESYSTTIDTGLVMNTTIYILLALAGAAGVFYVVKRKSSSQK